MKKFLLSALMAGLMVLAMSALALAAGEAVKVELAKLFWATIFGACFGLGFAAFGTGLSQGMAVKGAVESIARNPEAGGKIQTAMIIGLAMIESLCIYALVVALIALYAYPMAGPVAKALGIQ